MTSTLRNRSKNDDTNNNNEEKVEKKEENDTSTTTTTTTKKNRYKTRKEMPSIQYLLAHGDPETAHLPKTWGEMICFPLMLAITFAISLLIFHHAPHHLSTHEGFRLPQQRKVVMKNQQQMQQQMQQQQQQQQMQQQQIIVEDEKEETAEG